MSDSNKLTRLPMQSSLSGTHDVPCRFTLVTVGGRASAVQAVAAVKRVMRLRDRMSTVCLIAVNCMAEVYMRAEEGRGLNVWSVERKKKYDMQASRFYGQSCAANRFKADLQSERVRVFGLRAVVSCKVLRFGLFSKLEGFRV